MSNDHKIFKNKCKSEIINQHNDKKFLKLSKDWFNKSVEHNYSYHFEWLGRPVIQYPQDLISIQQLIWSIKPDLIIETGIARGGSLLFAASILELISLYGINKKSKVLGIDIEIRDHNLKEITKSPLFKRINLIEGSSIDEKVKKKVNNFSKKFKKILIFLDSNHSHKHVLEELKFYSKFVSKGSYCIVFDTAISKLDNTKNKGKNWSSTSNPYSAVKDFIKYANETKIYDREKSRVKFFIDDFYEKQSMITVAPSGFLKRL